MSSMGGTLGLYGDVGQVGSAPFDSMRGATRANATMSAMKGVGLDPEVSKH